MMKTLYKILSPYPKLNCLKASVFVWLGIRIA